MQDIAKSKIRVPNTRQGRDKVAVNVWRCKGRIRLCSRRDREKPGEFFFIFFLSRSLSPSLSADFRVCQPPRNLYNSDGAAGYSNSMSGELTFSSSYFPYLRPFPTNLHHR